MHTLKPFLVGGAALLLALIVVFVQYHNKKDQMPQPMPASAMNPSTNTGANVNVTLPR